MQDVYADWQILHPVKANNTSDAVAGQARFRFCRKDEYVSAGVPIFIGPPMA